MCDFYCLLNRTLFVNIPSRILFYTINIILIFAKKMMTFTEYLQSKKIDEAKFRKAEPQRFDEWEMLFTQMHPESFTSQKKFLLNPIRRKYLLQ